MPQHNVVIVGGGIIGLSTAYALLKQGATHVTVLEQATIDHQRSSSHGLSRLLRSEYGNDAFYSAMVRMSLKLWQDLELHTQKKLYTQTGLVTLGNENDSSESSSANSSAISSYYTLRALGHTPELLSGSDCSLRFPQFNCASYNFFTYNPEAGMLHASSCLLALKQCILALGGQILEAQCVTRISHENQAHPIRVFLASGDELYADRVVLALGAWVHRLLEGMHLPVRLTRQYLLYFAHLPDAVFGHPAFPAFMADDLYGFPVHNTCTNGVGPAWLKAASHNFGIPVDPDDAPAVDADVILQITHALTTLIPALEQATLAHVDSCIYDVSPDEHFILDYHPHDPRLIIASGLSGHSFKFGLLLGEMLSCLVREEEPPVSIQPFRLGRFSKQYQSPTHSIV